MTAPVDPAKIAANKALKNPLVPPAPGTSAQPPGKTSSGTPGASVQATTTVGAVENAALEQILEDETHYQPNIMSTLRQPTYNFKLFMTTEHEIMLNTTQTSTTTNSTPQGAINEINTLYNIIDSLPQAIIAESGVTAGYVITDVEFNHAFGPGWRNKNALLRDLSFNITEPLGSSLMESILTSSQALGVNDYTKMWYYLELTFKGYNADGSINLSPLESLGLPNGGRWIYQITITSVEMKLTESGCTYSFKCVFTGDEAHEGNTWAATPDNISATGGTIKEYLDDFAKNLTKAWTDRYLGDVVRFKINIKKISDDPRNPATFKVVKTDFDDMRGLGISDNSGVPTGNIPAQTKIIDVITFAYAHCEEAQKMMLDTNTAGELEDAASSSSATATYNGKQYRVPIVPVIETDTKIYGYDPVMGIYMKEITFTIWSYRSYNANLSVSQSDNIKNDPTITGKIAQELLKRGCLTKRYEYQFTGLNTEIIKYDTTYNFGFATLLPKITGWRKDFTAVSDQAKYNPALVKGASMEASPNEISKGNAATGQTPAAVQNQAATSPLTISQIQTKDNDYQGQIDAINGPNGALSNPANKNPKTGQVYTPQERQALSNQANALVVARDSLRADAQTQRDRYNANTNAARAVIEKSIGKFYTEDTITGKIKFNMTYMQAHSDIDDGIGTSGPWHRGASLVGALMNQLYTPVGDFQVPIELEIRGDPYWIGYSFVERRAAMSDDNWEPKTNTNGQPLLANISQADQTFALIYRFPSSINPTTGVPTIRKSDVFNGIYTVTNVKNTFSNGEFKQTLSAYKSMLLTVQTDAQPNATDPSTGKPTSSTTGQ